MKSLFKSLLAVCCWPLFLPSTAQANTHVWSGNGINDLFTTAANWSSGGVPAVGEPGVILLKFPAGSGSTTPLDNIPGLAVDGISFAGGNYTLRGSGGVTLTLRRADVTAFSILCTASGGLPNNIDTSLPLVIASTTRVQTDFVLHMDSIISGIGGLKIEGGDVHLRGTASNTYSFTTTVQGGASTLYLEKSNGFASIGGDLVVSGGVVRNQGNYQLGSTDNITINDNGLYAPGAFLEHLPATHFDQGTLQLTTNSGVVLQGDVSVSALGGTITGSLGLTGPARTFHVDTGGTLFVGKLTNGLNIAAGLIKTGPGNLVLSGINTFTGDVTVSEGSCYAQTSAALGAGNGTTSVGAGANLLFQGSGLNFSNKTLNLAGTVVLYTDAIWNGPITLFGTGSNVSGGTGPGGPFVLTHTGVISGAGKLTKGGTCRLVLAGNTANAHSGGTRVIGGELSLGKDSGNAIPGGLQIDAGSVFLTNSNQISDTSAVEIHGGILDLGARVDTIGSLAGTGGEVRIALGTLTTGDAGTTTYSGLLSGYGTTSIIKQGSGTFILNNSANGGDTLTGTILVNQGTLQMDGLHPGPVTVSVAGLLTGSGTIGATTVQDGKVGLCALKTGNLLINGVGSQAVTEITSGSYGHIKVTGSVNLTQSSLSGSLTYVPPAGSSFTLLENDGTDLITGIFSGLPEGSSVNLGTQIFNISYLGGTGNDVVLTLVGGGLPAFGITSFTISPVPNSNPPQFGILIEGTSQPDTAHRLQTSIDLLLWQDLPGTLTSDAQGHFSSSFVDLSATKRFYRLAVP